MIAIIAVLAIIAYVNYASFLAKARDTKRIADLKGLTLDLESYYQKNGSYPQGDDSNNCTKTNIDALYENPEFAKFRKEVPLDPKGERYCYVPVNSGKSYRLFTKLENCGSANIDPDNCLAGENNYTETSSDIIAAGPGTPPPPPLGDTPPPIAPNPPPPPVPNPPPPAVNPPPPAVNPPATAATYTVNPTAFVDSNNNLSQDDNEAGLGGVIFSISPPGQPANSTATGSSGQYSWQVPTGSYTISLNTIPSGYSYSWTTQTVSVDSASTLGIANFPFTGLCSGTLVLSLSPSSVAAGGSVTPSVASSNLSNCLGKTIAVVREGGTTADARCSVGGSNGCNLSSFNAPTQIGNYTYFAYIEGVSPQITSQTAPLEVTSTAVSTTTPTTTSTPTTNCFGTLYMTLPATATPLQAMNPSVTQNLTNCGGATLSIRKCTSVNCPENDATGSCSNALGEHVSNCSVPTGGSSCTLSNFSAPQNLGTYYYRICGNKGSDSIRGNIQTVTVSPTASVPGAPTITSTAVVAVAGSQPKEGITINWSVPSSGSSPILDYTVTYQIVELISSGAAVTGQPVNTITGVGCCTKKITGLNWASRYEFKVAARNAAGTGAFSSAAYKPSAPTNLRVTATSSNTIDVAWDAPTQALEAPDYGFAACEGATCTPNYHSTGNQSHRTYQFTINNGLDKCNTQYTLAVSPLNYFIGWGAPATIVASTGACTVTTRNITANVYLDSNNNGTQDDQLYTGSGVTVAIDGTSYSGTTSTGIYTFTSIPSATYNVRLSGVPTGYTITNNPLSADITQSNSTINFGIRPNFPVPTNLTATAINQSQINLVWNTVSGTGGYLIYRCQGSGCTVDPNSSPINSIITQTSYTDSNLSGDTSYSYGVKATQGTGNPATASPLSNIASDTTLLSADCADGSREQNLGGGSMVRCAGSATHSGAPLLCHSSSHLCSLDEYLARGGATTAPPDSGSYAWLSTGASASVGQCTGGKVYFSTGSPEFFRTNLSVQYLGACSQSLGYFAKNSNPMTMGAMCCR